MPQPKLEALVAKQISSLRNTQAATVWIRRDIIDQALGKEEVEKLISGAVVMGQRKPTNYVLDQQIRKFDQLKAKESHRLVEVDREDILEALLGWVEKTTGKPQQLEIINDKG